MRPWPVSAVRTAEVPAVAPMEISPMSDIDVGGWHEGVSAAS
jgi:hypothetical protein